MNRGPVLSFFCDLAGLGPTRGMRSGHVSILSPVLALGLALASTAAADTLGAAPSDPGRVTRVGPGVKELDVGGLFLFSLRAEAGATTTSISTLAGIGLQHFLRANVSVGGTLLASYEDLGGGVRVSAAGAAVSTTHHWRLGLGAFLRPGAGIGLLLGRQRTELGPGQLASATVVTGLVQLAAPIAYFPSPRLVLQAGPEFIVALDRVSPAEGAGHGSTRVTGGFAVRAGYVF